MATKDLTAQRLREILHYDPETGEFTWLVRLSHRVRCIGSVAGVGHKNGYIYIGINGTKHLAHRLAWLYMTGEWPKQHVDHLSGATSDNRWSNLRDVSRSTNLQNMRRALRTSKSGCLGVSWSEERQRWVAAIRISGKQTILGRFETIIDAWAAYLKAKRLHHVGCTI